MTDRLTELDRAALLAKHDLGAVLRGLGRLSVLPEIWHDQVWAWCWWLVVIRGYRAEHTAARYVEAVGWWGDWLLLDAAERPDDPADWQAMRVGDWDRWQRRLYLDQQFGAGTRRTIIAALRSFCGWRSRCGLGPDTAADALTYPKRVIRAPRKYTAAQMRAMLVAAAQHPIEAARLRNVALVLFLWATGGRREEVCQLELSQLDVQGEKASVRFFGKGAKERVVWFEGPAVAALSAWLEARSKLVLSRSAERRVWTHCRTVATCGPLQYAGIETVIRKVAKLAKLPDSGVHRFRVTFATDLFDAGADIERIRIALGHNSIETTRRYLAIADRQRNVRLPSLRQHAALGTRPTGLPLWATKRQPGVPLPLTPFTPPEDDR